MEKISPRKKMAMGDKKSRKAPAKQSVGKASIFRQSYDKAMKKIGNLFC